jgi:hypothetical protein
MSLIAKEMVKKHRRTGAEIWRQTSGGGISHYSVRMWVCDSSGWVMNKIEIKCRGEEHARELWSLIPNPEICTVMEL